MSLGPGNDDLGDVRRTGIVDRPRSGERGERCYRALATPAMATDTGALEYNLAARIWCAAAISMRGRCWRRQRRGQIGRGDGGDAAQVSPDRADVFRRQLAKALVYGFTQRSR